MPQDGASGTAASGFAIMIWRSAGFFACLFNGKLGRYAYYQRQAAFESGEFTSPSFVEGGNAFGMAYSESNTPRAVGARQNGEGTATYISMPMWMDFAVTRWWAYYRSWKDRFAWDDAYVAKGELSYSEWAHDVAYSGYAGGSSATQAKREAYYQALMSMEDNSGTIGGWFSDENTVAKFFVQWAFFLFLFLVVLWLLRRLWTSKWRKKWFR